MQVVIFLAFIHFQFSTVLHDCKYFKIESCVSSICNKKVYIRVARPFNIYRAFILTVIFKGQYLLIYGQYFSENLRIYALDDALLDAVIIL